eukprot:5736518-Amphidinium_carterae.1
MTHKAIANIVLVIFRSTLYNIRGVCESSLRIESDVQALFPAFLMCNTAFMLCGSSAEMKKGLEK